MDDKYLHLYIGRVPNTIIDSVKRFNLKNTPKTRNGSNDGTLYALSSKEQHHFAGLDKFKY